jgi:hypothetical protein
MRAPHSYIVDERNLVVPILEKETADIKAMIDEIWRRFTVRAREMQRSSSQSN